jgi:hypothetical protein
MLSHASMIAEKEDLMKVVKVFVPSALGIWISVAAKVWL